MNGGFGFLLKSEPVVSPGRLRWWHDMTCRQGSKNPSGSVPRYSDAWLDNSGFLLCPTFYLFIFKNRKAVIVFTYFSSHLAYPM